MLLLDTNILLELRKVRSGKALRPIVEWEARVEASELYLSVATIQEIESGILNITAENPTRASVLRAWFATSVLSAFHDRILVVDSDVARRCAYLHTLRSRDPLDTALAATAYVHNMPVVTGNVADFEDTGVRIINPWQL